MSRKASHAPLGGLLRILPLLLAWAVAGHAPPAMGQPMDSASPAPDATEAQRARQHFTAGEVLYRKGLFSSAIEQYKAALELDTHPSHLFNIAQCHRQLGSLRQAIFYYKLHISDWQKAFHDTPSPWQDEADRHIKELSARLGQKDPSEACPAPPVVEPTPCRCSDSPGDGQQTAGPAWLRTTSWALLGVGGAALATGLAFGLVAADRRAEYDELVTGTTPYGQLTDLRGEVNTYNQVALASLICGAVLTVASGTYLLTDSLILGQRAGQSKKKRPEKTVWITPVGGPGHLGVSALARF